MSESMPFENATVNAAIILNRRDSKKLEIDDSRVHAANVIGNRSILVRTKMRYNTVESISTSATDPSTPTMLVDIYGTDGVFKELFAAIREATDWSKERISSLLRQEFPCVRKDKHRKQAEFKCDLGPLLK